MGSNQPSNPEMMIRILEQQIELLKMQKKQLEDENVKLKTQLQLGVFGLAGVGMLVAFTIFLYLWVSSFR